MCRLHILAVATRNKLRPPGNMSILPVTAAVSKKCESTERRDSTQKSTMNRRLRRRRRHSFSNFRSSHFVGLSLCSVRVANRFYMYLLSTHDSHYCCYSIFALTLSVCSPGRPAAGNILLLASLLSSSCKREHLKTPANTTNTELYVGLARVCSSFIAHCTRFTFVMICYIVPLTVIARTAPSIRISI